MASFGRRVRGRFSRPASGPAAGGLCEHLADDSPDPAPRTQQCGACDAQGTSWVDLRLCLTCGEVGCCDSSPWQHASQHAHQTGHPVVRSFEHGESWRWCYVDEMLG
jgi:CPA1 family monovalent cation:H+ antiporter